MGEPRHGVRVGQISPHQRAAGAKPEGGAEFGGQPPSGEGGSAERIPPSVPAPSPAAWPPPLAINSCRLRLTRRSLSLSLSFFSSSHLLLACVRPSIHPSTHLSIHLSIPSPPSLPCSPHPFPRACIPPPPNPGRSWPGPGRGAPGGRWARSSEPPPCGSLLLKCTKCGVVSSAAMTSATASSAMLVPVPCPPRPPPRAQRGGGSGHLPEGVQGGIGGF